MIKSVTVTNHLGDILTLELAAPDKSGFVVRSITGLGPGKATINTTETPTSDGGLYNSSRIPIRNIVISLVFLWKNSIEDARQKSYRYFPLKKKVKLLIETDNRKAEIEGIVESNEPEIFSEEEGSDISILCPDPLFYSAGIDGLNTSVFYGVTPMFEFPFSNESLSDNLLEMGSIQKQTEKVIVYNGDAETGMTITIHAMGPATGISIYNLNTREAMHINTDKIPNTSDVSGLIAGDDIVICTFRGRKSIKLVREGKTTNLLNCLDKNVDWLKLSTGDNIFAYAAETGVDNIQFKIEHRVVYEGV